MNINRLLACLLSSFIALPSFAQDNRAPKGTMVFYIEDHQDRRMTGDFIMDAGIDHLKRRYEARLSEVMPSERYRIFTGADYASGAIARFFQSLAADAQGPIDVITLSHSSGEVIESPTGLVSVDDFLEQIPKTLESRLRLFYNAGCYGDGSNGAALHKGFVVSLGTERMSIGAIPLDEFLKHYLKGDSAVETARRVNAAMASSPDTTVAFLGYKGATGDSSTREEYVRRSSLKVRAASPRAETAGLTTSAGSLPGMRATEDEGQKVRTAPDVLAAHAADLLPDPIKSFSVRAVSKHAEIMQGLPTRIGMEFDGSKPYLPDEIEVDARRFDVTKTRFAPIRVLDNAVLAYERATDRGIQHEIEVVHVAVPLAAYSAGGEGILARVAADADIEAGYRHRPGVNTGYAELHARVETMLEVYRTAALYSRAEIWAAVENAGARIDAELSTGARVALNDKGARLEAGYSRFYSDLLNRARGAKDDFDAFLIGVTIGR